MNLDLLREFSLEAAQRGEEICWYDDGEPVTFLAEAGPDGEHALRDADGNVLCSRGIHLRMRPLAWCEKKPVYKGDVLYWKYDGLEHHTHHASSETNTALISDKLTWTKPEPKKTTRTVKFLGYRTGCGELVLMDESEDEWEGFKRVPGADVTYEVEE